MERFRQYLKGDISLWGVILFFAMLSFLPVYSSSSNLVYIERTGISTWGYLIRHLPRDYLLFTSYTSSPTAISGLWRA